MRAECPFTFADQPLIDSSVRSRVVALEHVMCATLKFAEVTRHGASVEKKGLA
jgi:hypothetical protein